jgi:hypothetical protein
VLVWDEQQPQQKEGYGEKFLGETIAAHLAKLPGLSVKTAKIDDADQGLSDATLDATDVPAAGAVVEAGTTARAPGEEDLLAPPIPGREYARRYAGSGPDVVRLISLFTAAAAAFS